MYRQVDFVLLYTRNVTSVSNAVKSVQKAKNLRLKKIDIFRKDSFLGSYYLRYALTALYRETVMYNYNT